MNVGVLGGTFNPPHNGHLLLAESARVELGLDLVLFVPAWRSPFKDGGGVPDAETRCEMVALAVSDNPFFACDHFEALRPTVSYTVDTLRHLRATRPDDTLHLLLGADAFAEFHLWRDPDEIVHLATLAVARRGAAEAPLHTSPYGTHARSFRMPAVDFSSTDIRARAREGKSVRYLVPWTVATFIEATGLYRDP